AARLSRAHARPRLHLLREVLGAAAQRIDCAALGVDGGIGVAFAERTFGVAHRLLGAAERPVALFALLALLARPTLAQLPALSQFLEQLVELFAQRLLVLPQLAHALLLTALVGTALLLPALSALPVAATLVLPLAERAVAQLLLLTQHVAQFVERRHHVVVIVGRSAGLRHLQVLEHRLQFLEQPPRRVLVAGARQ